MEPPKGSRSYSAATPLQSRYAQAGAVWDERIGTARAQAMSWRLAAFASFALTALCIIGLIIQSTKAQVVGYVVEAMPDGTVRYGGRLEPKQVELSELQKRYVLERWIEAVRGLSSDKAVVKARFNEAVVQASGRARLRLEGYVEQTKPFEKLGKVTITTELVSLTQVSDETLRAEWREDIFDIEGLKLNSSLWVGDFSLVVIPPKTPEAARQNPLGVYVDYFSWSERTGVPVPELPAD